MEYANLRIETIVLHELVKGGLGSTAATAILSDVPSSLNSEQKGFIQSRISGALADSAREIVEDPGTSPAPDLMRTYFRGEESLLELSRKLVGQLQALQPAISPGGIFVLASVLVQTSPALLVAKLEHEQGVRAFQRTVSGGNTTFDVEVLRDLLFTKGSRVYKVALFPANRATEQPLTGNLVDHQMGGSTLAAYFLISFLGFQLAERSDVLTERFLKGAEGWINRGADPEKKGRYELSLLSEMQSNRSRLSVDEFASAYLDLADRDDFVAAMTSYGSPHRGFSKDTTLVRSKINKLKVETESGVMILAPTDVVAEGIVSIKDNEDETSTVVVTDKITRCTGAGTVRKSSGPGADGGQ